MCNLAKVYGTKVQLTETKINSKITTELSLISKAYANSKCVILSFILLSNTPSHM